MEPHLPPFVLRRRGGWRTTVFGAAFVAFLVLVVRADTFFLVLACAGLACLLAQAFLSRLELRAGGVLVGRGVLPGSAAEVDLGALRRVECKEVAYTRAGGTGPSGRRPQRVVKHELRITDTHGRALTVEPSHWEPPQTVIDAVATAAHAQGIDVVGGELFGIGDPPPQAAAPPPATEGDAGRTSGPSIAGAGAQPLPENVWGEPAQIALDVRLRLAHRLVPAGLFGVSAVAVPLGRALFDVLTGTTTLFLVLAAAAVAAGVVASTATFLRSDDAGRLEVRSWPPLVTRSVRLDRLVLVEARASTGLVSTWSGGYRRNALIELADADGDRLRVILDAWQDGDWIRDVLAHWARRCDVAVDGPTRRLLVDGEPPRPAARF